MIAKVEVPHNASVLHSGATAAYSFQNVIKWNRRLAVYGDSDLISQTTRRSNVSLYLLTAEKKDSFELFDQFFSGQSNNIKVLLLKKKEKVCVTVTALASFIGLVRGQTNKHIIPVRETL